MRMFAIRIDQTIVSQQQQEVSTLRIRSVQQFLLEEEWDIDQVPVFRTGSKQTDQQLLQQLRDGCVPFQVLLEQAKQRQAFQEQEQPPMLRRQTSTWF